MGTAWRMAYSGEEGRCTITFLHSEAAYTNATNTTMICLNAVVEKGRFRDSASQGGMALRMPGLLHWSLDVLERIRWEELHGFLSRKDYSKEDAPPALRSLYEVPELLPNRQSCWSESCADMVVVDFL